MRHLGWFSNIVFLQHNQGSFLKSFWFILVRIFRIEFNPFIFYSKRSFVCWSPLSLPLSFAGALSSSSTFSSLSKSSATSSLEWRNISSLSSVYLPTSTGNTKRDVQAFFLMFFGFSCSCLNPIIYGFMSKSFRQSFVAELRSCCCRYNLQRVVNDPKSQELKRNAQTTIRQNGSRHGSSHVRINQIEEARPLTVT